MGAVVKPRRRYESARRRAQAAQTRRDVLAAAGKLFRERGYTGTSMPAIAAEAGVVVETIYRSFSGKAGLFKAVVQAAIAGGAVRAEVPPEQRPALRAVIEEDDPRRQVVLYASTQPGIHRRSDPLVRALRDASAADPELEKLWEEMETERYVGQGRFVELLAEREALRPDMTVERGRDIMWTLCSPGVYELLVGARGWTAREYRDWLATALIHELLPAESA